MGHVLVAVIKVRITVFESTKVSITSVVLFFFFFLKVQGAYCCGMDISVLCKLSSPVLTNMVCCCIISGQCDAKCLIAIFKDQMTVSFDLHNEHPIHVSSKMANPVATKLDGAGAQLSTLVKSLIY